jgi:hypothetical protein
LCEGALQGGPHRSFGFAPKGMLLPDMRGRGLPGCSLLAGDLALNQGEDTHRAY